MHGKHDDDAVSDSSVGHRELELRPRLRAGDLLESVPGLVVVQPEGGGKANEYFLRGFDADHGTDIAFFVDGVPINLVSHAHGQGFTDFNFIIPELVVGLDGYKGPYHAQFGDFATAGAVEPATRRGARGELRAVLDRRVRHHARFVHRVAEARRHVARGDRDGGLSRRWPVHPPRGARQIQRLPSGEPRPRAAQQADGDVDVVRLYLERGRANSGARGLRGRNRRTATKRTAAVGRFDTVDPSQGGSTQRHALSLAYSAATRDSDLTATAYAVRYDFKMFSNFTFFAVDPIHGDEIEQDDDRNTLGLDVRARTHAHYAGMTLTTTGGVQARVDAIDSALLHDEARIPLASVARANLTENELGAYAKEEIRLDRFRQVRRGCARGPDRRERERQGDEPETLFSPKFAAIVTPLPELELSADYGRGFHSNDARGTGRHAHGAGDGLRGRRRRDAAARSTPHRGRVLARPRLGARLERRHGHDVRARTHAPLRRRRSERATGCETGSSPTSTRASSRRIFAMRRATRTSFRSLRPARFRPAWA